ncbi:MAG: hypothetical protein ACO4CT_08465, partial [Planctomycetota bacterium]
GRAAPPTPAARRHAEPATKTGDGLRVAVADSGLPESGLASERARSPSDRSPGHADAVGLEVPRRWRPA